MKTRFRPTLPLALALLLAAALAATGCAAPSAPTRTDAGDVTTSAERSAADSAASAPAAFGAVGAEADAQPTLEDMLTYAIQDEYLARAEYAAIVSGTSFRNPFFGISRAESGHVGLLEPLFAAYGFDLPSDDAASRTSIPVSASDAYAAGVAAEIANIAMYERFLALDLPSDVRAVFEELAAASRNHLAAFQRNLARVA